MKVYLIVECYSNGVECWESIQDGFYLDETEAELKALELNEAQVGMSNVGNETSYSVRMLTEAAKQGGQQ